MNRAHTARLLGALTLAAALALVPTAAHAHEDLLRSTPDSGERLATAPASVELVFSGEVMTLGAAVVVADADGHDWTSGDPVVGEGGVVTVALESGMPDAGYEMRWRVVSADGHPISGVVPFTVGEGTPVTRTPAGVPPERGGSEGQITQGDGIPRVVVVGAAGAAAGAAVFALALLFTHRRSPRTDGSATEHSDAGDEPSEGNL